jgi:hypothetical protein
MASEREPYPSDLTDEQWALLEPYVCQRPGPGLPPTLALRAAGADGLPVAGPAPRLPARDGGALPPRPVDRGRDVGGDQPAAGGLQAEAQTQYGHRKLFPNAI